MAQKYRINLGMPMLLPDMEEAALDALRNDRYLNGENVKKFEEEFARKIGTEYAISLASGTAALQYIFMALGMKEKKVVTSTFSFIASANSIYTAGGIPVLADISDKDYCLDPKKAEEEVKNGASAVLPVHLYGNPVDFDQFEEISERYNVPIIEDACQAHGAKYKGKCAGALGIAAAFSFYPSKNMTVLGDGGMVTTNDEQVAKVISKLRDAGRISHYEHDMIGFTSRLNTVNAAIGRVQLKHLDEWNERRIKIAEMYASKLKGIEQVTLPPMPTDQIAPVYHQFVIRVKERDALKEHLEMNGIEAGIHYPVPIHLQPIYKQMYGYKEGMYKKSEAFAKECLSLPIHPKLSDQDVTDVVESIKEFYDRSKNV